MRRFIIVIVSCVAMLSLSAARASAYSVLAHEAAIDVAWDGSIKPLLLARFPHTSAEQLNRARAFAYGGSVIQDLGYYPFGNKFFSNLLHYTRSGDFVEALLRDAKDVDELAFAIGALAHYANDNAGHPEAVNRSVPLIFPKLRARFGDRITYEQAPKQHVMVEFSFDVAHTAETVYPLSAYRNLIGFQVATPLLARAFRQTYGLELQRLFPDLDRSIATYRYSVSQIIPALTEAAWRDRGDEIVKASPTASRQTFVLVYGRANFEHDYGADYQKPARFARLLAIVYRFVPKVGPLKPLTFKAPTAEANALFAASVADANVRFARALAAERSGRLDLTNTNFDIGRVAARGEYAMADETYDELVERLDKQQFDGMTPPLRRNIETFYGSAKSKPAVTRKDADHDARIGRALAALADWRDSGAAPARAAR